MPTFQIETTDSQCTVTWRQFSSYAHVIVIFVALSIVTAFFLHSAFVQPVFVIGLAGLVFGGVGFLALAGIIDALFGKTKIILDKEGLEMTYTCLWIKRGLRRNLTEIRRLEPLPIIGHKNGATYKLRAAYKLRAVCQKNNNANFALPLLTKESKKELNALCDHLNIFLGTLKAAKSGVPAQWELPEAMTFDFDSPPQHLDPPPKSQWLYQTDYFDGVVFKKRNFLDFFGTTTWTFAHGEAEYRTVRFGWGRTTNHSLTGWNSLLVCLPDGEQVKPELIAEGNPDAIRDFYNGCALWRVVFLTAGADRLLAIEGLSKPEALWMADVLIRERRAVQ